MKALLRVERDFLKKRIPEFSVGDTVKVHVKVVEGDKVRNQIFQGT
ncbi:MAG TPA: 50S ribosomal protein L19, partial [Candidatus Eisenbacteria bacterium]|nr:50S ribosomal protein L19 [Candidatus Eisenbacteria bacterium]